MINTNLSKEYDEKNNNYKILIQKIIDYTKYNNIDIDINNDYDNDNDSDIYKNIYKNTYENTFNTNNYKIQKILGSDFKYKCIFEETKNISETYCFKFINKSKILNINKYNYIKEKINQLWLNGFFEVENLKISNIGRFLVIKIKTIDDYTNEKEILKQEYLNKINLIEFKIEMIKNKK